MSHIHIIMIVVGFLIGVGGGFMMHRADYCVAGMFRDFFLFRSTLLLKTLVLLVAVSLPAFELLRLTGFVTVPFPFFGPASLVNIAGGFIFGVGMVLAGGCVVGTLYRVGAGSFPAVLTFAGLVAGSTIYAEIHPWWATVAKSLTLSGRSVTLPQLLSVQPWVLVILFSSVMSALIFKWYRQGALKSREVVDGYLQPWKAALGLAGLGVVSVMVLGMPMGITTSYAKFGAMLLKAVVPAYYDSLAYFKVVPLKYVPPVGGGTVTGGPGTALDAVALVQFPLIAGILAGSAWSASTLGEWHIRFKLPWRQVISAVLGGIIMGLASRMAPACNIWHLFGGLPIMALQSILFLAGLFPGAWFGSILLTRFVVTR